MTRGRNRVIGGFRRRYIFEGLYLRRHGTQGVVCGYCLGGLDHSAHGKSSSIHLATRPVEIVGTAIIVVGAFATLGAFLFGLIEGASDRARLVADFRSGLGRSILLGLVFLVAADIINTEAIESLLVLAGIAHMRTFLSFSLEVAIDGRWPWPWQKERSTQAKPYEAHF